MNEPRKVELSVRGLTSAILLQAIWDYRSIKKGTIKESETVNEEELKEFFASEWFQELCDMCNVDPRVALKAVYGGKHGKR